MIKTIQKIFSLTMFLFLGGFFLCPTWSQEVEGSDVKEQEISSSEEVLLLTEEWKKLGVLEYTDYLDKFSELIDLSFPHKELEPYIMAESLWFESFVFPSISEEDKKNYGQQTSELQLKIDNFFASIENEETVLNQWTNQVYKLFVYMTGRKYIPSYVVPVRKLTLFQDAQDGKDFIPPDEITQKLSLYKGYVKLEELIALYEDFKNFDETQKKDVLSNNEQTEGESKQPETKHATGSESVQENDASLQEDIDIESRDKTPVQEKETDATLEGQGGHDDSSVPADTIPFVPGIDWREVTSDPIVMYLMDYTEEAKEIKTFVSTYYHEVTMAERGKKALMYCRELGEQYGFLLEDVVSPRTATIASFAEEDYFILYCLNETDIEDFTTDLECLHTIGSYYFQRLSQSWLKDENQCNPEAVPTESF